MISENNFEQNRIEKLIKLGYTYLNQREIRELRGGWDWESNVLLKDKLSDAIFNLNPNINQKHVNEIIGKIEDLKSSSLVEGNEMFHNYLNNGVKIYDEIKNITLTYKIIDKLNEKNDWIVTNQFRMKSTNSKHKVQIPDMVIFCNGMPMIVFELKKIDDNSKILNAYEQIKNYEVFLKDLFIYNAFNVIDDFSEVKYGTITSDFSRYKYWRGINFDSGTENLYSDLLFHEKIIDVITNFTFFTSNKIKSKIIASYHQYYGVKLAVDSCGLNIENKTKVSNGKAGIFWHTQGSGKSFSMLFLVKEVSKIIPNTTFIIVTDRTDLDNQLYKTFTEANKFIGQKIHKISSRDDLEIELKNKTQDGVYFTTIQKFSDKTKILSARENILIISDEAHRSHTQIDSSLEYDSTKNKLIEKSGNAKYIRDAFPKATFIGFTGTPIEKDDKSTTKIFGNIITKYLMTDAERDGVVVPIRYESRKAELTFNYEKLQELNEKYNSYLEKIVSETEVPNEFKKKINKSLQQMKNIIGDPDRIFGVAQDFILHYEKRKNYLKGKAMFVAFNRKIAFDYYKAILKIKPDWKNKVKLIITNSNGQSDSPELIKASGTNEYRKKMAAEFKNVDSDFKIAIVVDMWLTGFDVPSLDSIYLDKPIKMHNLMQTIARTNRVYSDENSNKGFGLVVDYVGLWKQLNEALSFYTGKNIESVKNEMNVNTIKYNYIDDAKEIIKQFDLSENVNVKDLYKNKKLWVNTLENISNKIIKNKLQQNFINATKNLRKKMDEIIQTLNNEELFIFQILILTRNNIINIELGKVDFSNVKIDLLNKIKETIAYKNISVVNQVEGDAILISEIIEFIKKEERNEFIDLDVYTKIGATRKILDYTKKINFKKSEDLEKKLNDLLRKYDEQHVSLDELIRQIKSIAVEAESMTKKELDENGFTQTELSFYYLVNEPVKDEYDSKMIIKIVKELLEVINKNEEIISSWSYNEQQKMNVRKELTLILLNNDYPPETSVTTADDIIKQIMYEQNIK